MKTTGRTHTIVATTLGAMLVFRLDLHPLTIIPAIIGGIFPDTDTKSSIIGRWIPLWLIFKPHRRNITHSFLGAVLFSLPWLYISYTYSVLFFFGYMIHLFLDMFNRTGIPFAYPNKHMVSIASVKAGGTGELLLTIAFYIMMLAVLI